MVTSHKDRVFLIVCVSEHIQRVLLGVHGALRRSPFPAHGVLVVHLWKSTRHNGVYETVRFRIIC
jgi:hypothetical protein